MGYRLSKIYTRTGDKGTTGLAGGERIDKDSPRIEAIGDIDELNSVIGLLLTESVPEEIQAILLDVQHRLFDIGGGLSIPDVEMAANNLVQEMEQSMDRMIDQLQPLKEFILPGGTRTAALCHLARSVCRRAERHLIALNRREPVGEFPLQYLNRLSDLLFVIARTLNKNAGKDDIYWQSQRLEK